MGFWQTGYFEHHEKAGLDEYLFDQLPPEYGCTHCSRVFASVDELRTHRFEDHPLYRPTLMLKGRELGSHPVRITAPLRKSDVVVGKCDRAILNGETVTTRHLPVAIAALSHGVNSLTLFGGEVSAQYTLDVRLATLSDLQGIEREFERIATGRRLDARTIDAFITASHEFESAMGYCDGICAYLFGVLAKERSTESSLPFDAYIGKYSKAAEELAAYDRPLARAIGSLIEFHFNHFTETVRLARRSRIGQVASRYDAWLRGVIVDSNKTRPHTRTRAMLEELVSDWDTEQIARWAEKEADALLQCTSEMEEFLQRALTDYDRLKVHILLAEVYAHAGDAESALRHAKSLRNLAAVESWAERLIKAMAGEKHDLER